MRTIVAITALLALFLVISPMAALGTEEDEKPVITAHNPRVDAGKEFMLEVTVEAWLNASYNVSFDSRSRFSFPGPAYKEYDLEKSDSILFKIPCMVEEGTPDGDYNIPFKVTWFVNDTKIDEDDGVVRVAVGEGSKTDGMCQSAMVIGPVSIAALSVLLVGRRERKAL